MPAWLPILKAALPYVTQIVTTAIPVFSAKTPASKGDDVLSRQISELQSAATQNAESIRVLAEKLQATIQGIDAAANTLQKGLITLKRLVIGALLLAVIALLLAAWSLLR